MLIKRATDVAGRQRLQQNQPGGGSRQEIRGTQGSMGTPSRYWRVSEIGDGSVQAMREISNTAREERRRQRGTAGGGAGEGGGKGRWDGCEHDINAGAAKNNEDNNQDRMNNGQQVALGRCDGTVGRGGATGVGGTLLDEHQGNVHQASVRMNGEGRRFDNMGLDVSIIDFSLSRLRCGERGGEGRRGVRVRKWVEWNGGLRT